MVSHIFFTWEAQDANDWKVGFVYFITLLGLFLCLCLNTMHLCIGLHGAWMLVSNGIVGNSLTDRKV